MKNQKKILIVDDDPDILAILAFNLIKEGYKVTSASDGISALQEANKVIPDLILLDIMMPRMDGIDVCKEIRKQDSFKNTLIAFLTAKDEDQSQIEALDLGGDDYITKPIRPKLLMSRINALFRRNAKKKDELDNNLSFGDLMINKEDYIIKKSGEQVKLAKKEFELLALLSGRPGKVFTREEIFNKVWGPDIIVGERTLDVHIRKLREKIGVKYIKTLKGIGYKFEF